MKILHITTAFARNEKDFITPWLTETLKRLKEENIDCEVFTSSYLGLKNQRIFNIPVYRFRYFFKNYERLTHEENVPDRLKKSFFYKILLIFYLFFGLLNLIILLRKKSYDIIHIHWPLPHFFFAYLSHFFAPKKPRLISSFYGVEFKFLKSRLIKKILEFIIKKSDKVTAISNYTAQEIKKYYEREIKIIPFSAAVKTFLDREENRKTDQKTILFVGRLVKRKGVNYLILALKEVLKEIKVKLMIIGEGSERKNLENLTKELELQEYVEFKGFISDKELAYYYQNCDLFVLPAIIDERGDTEGLGVVLLEAMVYKKPVIASAVGGILDIVKDYENGILVPEKEPKILAKKILEVIRDEKLAKRLGENGYRFVKENFSWEKIINDLKILYKETLKINPS
ncbi:MAG: glycosyltransferase family 4 protein [candidate division WOR-3 bacterium]|nr:glycosyltransferase family 4 protein [candidate division WOR-3 bacterium]